MTIEIEDYEARYSEGAQEWYHADCVPDLRAKAEREGWEIDLSDEDHDPYEIEEAMRDHQYSTLDCGMCGTPVAIQV